MACIRSQALRPRVGEENSHIDNIRKTGAIKRIKNRLNNIYHAHIQSHFSYLIPIWGQAQNTKSQVWKGYKQIALN